MWSSSPYPRWSRPCGSFCMHMQPCTISENVGTCPFASQKPGPRSLIDTPRSSASSLESESMHARSQSDACQTCHMETSALAPRGRQHNTVRPAQVSRAEDCLTGTATFLRNMWPTTQTVVQVVSFDHVSLWQVVGKISASVVSFNFPHYIVVTLHSGFKRVKGISHTAEERTSMHSHRPHAASQPAITVLTHAQLNCPTSTDTT